MPSTRNSAYSVKRSIFRGTTLLALIAGMVVAPAAVKPASPALAYNVCSDPDAPCVHEYMAAVSMLLYSTPPEILDHADEIMAGATHEDEIDHVYSLSHIGKALVTITHFWDADVSDFETVDNILGSFPNSWQKIQALWSMALGAYAKDEKDQAYHWFGHVVHLIGDHTIPTHVHEDMHGPDIIDDDAYEEWMSLPSDIPGLPLNAKLTPSDVDSITCDGTCGPGEGPIQIPPGVDPLYYLLYTTNQIADFFPSEIGALDLGDSAEENGDTFDRHGWVQGELDAMDAAVTSPRTVGDLIDNDIEIPGVRANNNDDDGDLTQIRRYSYLRGIRAIAGLYQTWAHTVTQQVSIAVVVDHIEEDEDHDYACAIVCVETSDPDFFARVVFPGRVAMNRGDEIVDDEVVDPGWAFGHTVGLTGSIPIQLEIWDHDGTGEDVITLGGQDDQSDIDPGGGGLGLELNVDIAACLRGAPGAISGEASGACGDTLISTGDNDDEASQVRFRIIMSKAPPTAEAGGPYTTNEGSNVTLDGTGSTDPDNDIVTYAWDLDGDGACDDIANDSTPDFTTVGQDGLTTVKLCVTDSVGLTAEDTATVTVNNVTPSISLASNAPKSENTAVTVTGTISDPGWLDTLSGTISWGDGGSPETLVGTLENARPDASLTFSASHTYGDNGSFSAQVCASDDDSSPCTTIALQIDNTQPTAAIDLSSAVSVNGTPTIIAHAGQAVGFSGRSTDPGSDDLTLAWAWGDGTAGASMLSLVNPPDSEPKPAASPSIQPRDVTFPQSHTFSGACVYETTFSAADDDGGATAQTANVIIVGNGQPNHPHGWWKQQFRHYVVGQGPSDFDQSELDCYLKIVASMSRVFHEATPATTFAQAYDVLTTTKTSAIIELFDQQLLAAWLNFADGAIEWNRLVDTNRDRVADTRFLDAMAAAESLRLDPSTTRIQLERQKVIVESWTVLP